MGKDKKSFRDDLEKLAIITDTISETILSKGEVNVIIELEKEHFTKVVSYMGDVYRNTKEFVINISGTKFTFVLKT
jgi:hypothetical protein